MNPLTHITNDAGHVTEHPHPYCADWVYKTATIVAALLILFTAAL